MMTDQFRKKLESIVNQVMPDGRARVQSEINSVLEMGASSYDDLLVILDKQEANVRILETICWILARYENENASTALIDVLLNSQETSLREEAARSLGTLGSRISVPSLLDRLLNDKSSSVRSASAYSLGLLGENETIPHLLRVLENPEESPEVRGSVADALSCQFGNDKVINALINTLKDDSIEVRFWSAFTLGQIGNENALPELERLAATDSQVLERWGSIKDEANQAIKYIKERIQDSGILF